MTTKFSEIIGEINTDISGKWVNIEELNRVIERVVWECSTLAHYNVHGIDASRKIRERFGVGVKE